MLTPPETSTSSGSVQAYYLPEDVILHRADRPDSLLDGLRTRIEGVDLTVPLARIRLASTPAISALTLHREIRLQDLTPDAR